MKLANFSGSGGRLQPEQWRILLIEQKGLLANSSLFSAAEAWLRVAQGLMDEGWVEQELQTEGGLMYVYHKGKILPPPYEGGSNWACRECERSGLPHPEHPGLCDECSRKAEPLPQKSPPLQTDPPPVLQPPPPTPICPLYPV